MRRGERLAAEAGLTTQQWIVLLQIAGDPNFPGAPRRRPVGVLPSEIAAARGVSRATVSAIVSALLERGLVEQIADDTQNAAGAGDDRGRRARDCQAGAGAPAGQPAVVRPARARRAGTAVAHAARVSGLTRGPGARLSASCLGEKRWFVMLRGLLAIVSVAVAAMACSGSSSGSPDGGDSRPSDAASPVPDSSVAPGADAAPGELSSFDVDAADAVCGALFRCCDGADQEQYFAPFRGSDLLAAWRDRLPPAVVLMSPAAAPRSRRCSASCRSATGSLQRSAVMWRSTAPRSPVASPRWTARRAGRPRVPHCSTVPASASRLRLVVTPSAGCFTASPASELAALRYAMGSAPRSSVPAIPRRRIAATPTPRTRSWAAPTRSTATASRAPAAAPRRSPIAASSAIFSVGSCLPKEVAESPTRCRREAPYPSACLSR